MYSIWFWHCGRDFASTVAHEPCVSPSSACSAALKIILVEEKEKVHHLFSIRFSF